MTGNMLVMQDEREHLHGGKHQLSMKPPILSPHFVRRWGYICTASAKTFLGGTGTPDPLHTKMPTTIAPRKGRDPTW